MGQVIFQWRPRESDRMTHGGPRSGNTAVNASWYFRKRFRTFQVLYPRDTYLGHGRGPSSIIVIVVVWDPSNPPKS